MSPAHEPWLSVLGIGAEGVPSLGDAGRAVLAAGEILVGSPRHLAMVPGNAGERLSWRRPLDATVADLKERRGRRVVVLASGDPMCFGVGELLARHFTTDEMRVIPAPSSFSLVCARLGWSLNQVACLSVHGRPLAAVNRHWHPGARVIALSDGGDSPGAIAGCLGASGYGPSRMWTFESMGEPGERRIEATAAAWPDVEIGALNTVAIECRADPGTPRHASTPGLPDEVFQSDGMLTKREVRAATLARLAPLPGERLWDVGAGSGAIAIEWLRATGLGHAVAIERDPDRCRRIAANATRLGIPDLTLINGSAPDCLAGLPAPDAVFIGGGLTVPGLIERCWQALPPGGRLVANAVTVESERILLDWQAAHGGDLVRIAVARLEPVGPLHGWRPALPVTQLAAGKP